MNVGENEITAGLRLLAELPLEGTVVTADAIFAQKKSANSL
jgi:predicted transposase YbfD/YdcC